MPNSRAFSATPQGMDGALVEIEAASQSANPGIYIAGLPNDVVRESRERVRACLSALGFQVPLTRIVVHLSPATARKQGSQFDLAIAVSVLTAEGLLPGVAMEKVAFLGELSLDGRIQPVPWAVTLLETLEESDRVDQIILGAGNAAEAALIRSRKTLLARTLPEVIDHLRGVRPLSKAKEGQFPCFVPGEDRSLDHVVGHSLGKRALAIAMAGRHHLLFIGPPGVGKTLLASGARGLLPPLTQREWIEVVKLHGHMPHALPLPGQIPFRAPHHSISVAGLLGGGSGIVVPGEVSLAHHGILFLDEFPEFRRDAIEGLREPLQGGVIHLHRVGAALSLRASFILLAAMNPCPCGDLLSPGKRCRCTPEKVTSYLKRVSGPILDRIDLCVVLSRPESDIETPPELKADQLSQRIACAIAAQRKRNPGGQANSSLPIERQLEGLGFDSEALRFWRDQLENVTASYRSLHKIARLARTIADFEGATNVSVGHVREAKVLRCSDSYDRFLS